MYTLTGTPEQLTIAINDAPVLRLSQGCALLIGLTYSNLQRHSEAHAQDFLHGVVMGLNHVQMTGAVPVCVGAIPQPEERQDG
jgi:hypothetical protein